MEVNIPLSTSTLNPQPIRPLSSVHCLLSVSQMLSTNVHESHEFCSDS